MTAQMRRVGRRHPAYRLAYRFDGASNLGSIEVKKGIPFPRSSSRNVVVGHEGGWALGWKDKRCRPDKPRFSASAIGPRPPRPRLLAPDFPLLQRTFERGMSTEGRAYIGHGELQAVQSDYALSRSFDYDMLHLQDEEDHLLCEAFVHKYSKVVIENLSARQPLLFFLGSIMQEKCTIFKIES